MPDYTDEFVEDETQMVDFVTAYGKDGVGFTFRNGMDVPTKNE